ncbi:uncharacterized protein LOC128860623 [Anastrepha ludens]|uniref:uncharacterized protein LOC128860623 n=1 Tax=Anastrepha ludens TaxID=28586 RepID=UPI0023B170EC|nr:uncharacterized protein LOC128860623 [Anastrepha ludens]XP_053954232.1 uncharacterized protein LOC128860623 [Anastrepha ludens]XP_053954233.1 uncharacterized protein LOC128860623 [Anastrepha ludens]
MVLTNFECWAHGGSVVGNNGLPVNSRHVDMFNPLMVQHRLDTATGASAVSHISSNGYYGFSYVNAAHEPTDNNSDVTAAHARQNINNTNINTDRCVPNANDVNGMDFGDGAAAAAAAFGNRLGATQRCKKRYFVSDDDYANCELLNNCDKGIAAGVAVAGGDVCAAKRCRFDDDYDAAQYCNDFFSLPSTQIGTQSCLMDTEDAPYNQQQQQQQPQVDVNMGVANLSNQTGNTTTKRCRQAINYDAKRSNSFVNVYHDNINTANQNNNNKALFYNNHEIKCLSSSAAAYIPPDGAKKKRNGGDDNKCEIAEGDQSVRADIGNTYLMKQSKFPAFGAIAKISQPADIATSNEDTTGVAALYAKTHGGAFYQFTAANGGNQPYIEDI